MRKIKVIIKRPDEKIGHVCHISSALENLQKTVGGYIGVMELGGGAVMICNEEGRIKGLEPNFLCGLSMIVGTVIICGINGEEFDDMPISLDLWKRLLKSWNN